MTLWADIDTYLQAELLAELGAAGDYTTLKVKQVLIDETLTIEDISTPVIQAMLPVVLVRSHHAEVTPGAHGNGRVNIENIYTYFVIAVAQSTGKQQAKRDAQEMRMRLREFLRTRLSFGGLTATDGEKVDKVIWGGSDLEVIPNDKQPGNYFNVAAIGFKVQSK